MFGLLSSMILILLILTTTAVLLPKLTGAFLGLLFRGVGFLIQRRTRSRREYVVAHARSEEEEYRAQQTKNPASSAPRSQPEDEDWEKVDGSGSGAVRRASSSGSNVSGDGENGTKAGSGKDDDWDGIIGFFHPFWYGFSRTSGRRCLLVRQ